MQTVTHTQTRPYAAWPEVQDSWRCQTQTRSRQDISHSQKSTYAVSWDAVTSSRLDCRAHTHRQTPNLLLTWSFLRSPQKGRWEQRERMRLPEHCGCGSSWKEPTGRERRREVCLGTGRRLRAGATPAGCALNTTVAGQLWTSATVATEAPCCAAGHWASLGPWSTLPKRSWGFLPPHGITWSKLSATGRVPW